MQSVIGTRFTVLVTVTCYGSNKTKKQNIKQRQDGAKLSCGYIVSYSSSSYIIILGPIPINKNVEIWAGKTKIAIMSILPAT